MAFNIFWNSLEQYLYNVKGETRFRKRSCHECQKEKSFVTYHNRITTFHRSTVFISDADHEVLSLAKPSKSSSFYLLHYRKPPWIKWILKNQRSTYWNTGISFLLKLFVSFILCLAHALPENGISSMWHCLRPLYCKSL